MKKIIYCLIIFFISAGCTAAELNINELGTPVRINNTSIQNLAVDFIADGSWELKIMPVSDRFRHVSKNEITLPINRTRVQHELNEVEIQKNQTFIIAKGNDIGHKNLNIDMKAVNLDGDYPGDYTADFRFILLKNGSATENLYTLRISQPVIQEISTDMNSLNINIKAEDVFKKSGIYQLETPANIFISSNTDWELVLCPFIQNGDHYKYSTAMLCLPESAEKKPFKQAVLKNDKEIILAKGRPTVDKNTGILKNECLKLNYSVRILNDKFLESGVKSIQLDYFLLNDKR